MCLQPTINILHPQVASLPPPLFSPISIFPFLPSATIIFTAFSSFINWYGTCSKGQKQDLHLPWHMSKPLSSSPPVLAILETGSLPSRLWLLHRLHSLPATSPSLILFLRQKVVSCLLIRGQRECKCVWKQSGTGCTRRRHTGTRGVN